MLISLLLLYLLLWFFKILFLYYNRKVFIYTTIYKPKLNEEIFLFLFDVKNLYILFLFWIAVIFCIFHFFAFVNLTWWIWWWCYFVYNLYDYDRGCIADSSHLNVYFVFNIVGMKYSDTGELIGQVNDNY